MSDKRVFYAICIDSFVTIASVFCVVFLLIEHHQLLLDVLWMAAVWVNDWITAKLQFAYPAFVGASVVLIGLIFWITLVNWRMARLGKLTDSLSEKSRGVMTAALIGLVLALGGWGKLSPADMTPPIFQIIVGFILCCVCRCLVAQIYFDREVLSGSDKK